MELPYQLDYMHYTIPSVSKKRSGDLLYNKNENENNKIKKINSINTINTITINHKRNNDYKNDPDQNSKKPKIQ